MNEETSFKSIVGNGLSVIMIIMIIIISLSWHFEQMVMLTTSITELLWYFSLKNSNNNSIVFIMIGIIQYYSHITDLFSFIDRLSLFYELDP